MKTLTQENPTWVFDITIKENEANKIELKRIFSIIAKKWCFQLEKGTESGYLHFQCRISTKVKWRMAQVKKALGIESAHISITSNANKNNMFYVLKEDTRVEGPWSDTDVELYIPRQVREISALRPWQLQIVEDAKNWDTRHINIVFCPIGNIGKSILKTYIGVHQIGRSLPYSNDYKDIMRMVMDTPKKPLYIIDLPRAISKDKLYQFFSGVETLKDGYAYDDRYHFKEEYFDCPNIWIFMNTYPDLDLLSLDRWVIWQVKDNTLIRDPIRFVDAN